MGKVGTGPSTSLDGFIARPNGDVGPRFDWYLGGERGDAYRVALWSATRVMSSSCSQLSPVKE